MQPSIRILFGMRTYYKEQCSGLFFCFCLFVFFFFLIAGPWLNKGERKKKEDVFFTMKSSWTMIKQNNFQYENLCHIMRKSFTFEDFQWIAKTLGLPSNCEWIKYHWLSHSRGSNNSVNLNCESKDQIWMSATAEFQYLYQLYSPLINSSSDVT